MHAQSFPSDDVDQDSRRDALAFGGVGASQGSVSRAQPRRGEGVDSQSAPSASSDQLARDAERWLRENDPDYEAQSQSWKHVRRGNGIYRSPIEREIPSSDRIYEQFANKDEETPGGRGLDFRLSCNIFGKRLSTSRPGQRNGHFGLKVRNAGRTHTGGPRVGDKWIWEAGRIGRGESQGQPIRHYDGSDIERLCQNLETSPDSLRALIAHSERADDDALVVKAWALLMRGDFPLRSSRARVRQIKRAYKGQRDDAILRDYLAGLQAARRGGKKRSLRQIGRTFDVSPTTVREAIRRKLNTLLVSKRNDERGLMTSPTLAESNADHEQRIAELERWVGLPEGGPKAATEAVEDLLASLQDEKEG